LDLKTIAGSFESHLKTVKPNTSGHVGILRRMDSIQKFMDEYRNEDPMPGMRYFSLIPVHYQNWRRQHSEFAPDTRISMSANAIVYQGRDLKSGTAVAIKQLKVPKLKGARLKSFEREITTLGSVEHPTLLKFVGAMDRAPFAIVTEWVGGGTLQVELRKNHKFNSTIYTIAAFDIARGVAYLHSRSIIHRDLKSENILLTESGSARISNFGMSRSAAAGAGSRMTNAIGSATHLAPEAFDGTGVYDEKVDVYAFGVLLWEILTKKEPFAGMDAQTIMAQIRRLHLRPVIPGDAGGPLRELMETCWATDPETRPAFADIVAHWADPLILFPGADAAIVAAHVAKFSQEAMPPPECGSLDEIHEALSASGAAVERTDALWDSLVRVGRESNPDVWIQCLVRFLKTPKVGEAAALLRKEKRGAIPCPLAAEIAAVLPTGVDEVDLDLLIVACRNGATAEAAIHAGIPEHSKIALETVARVGISKEELRVGILYRCLHALKTEDPGLTVAALRCLIGIKELEKVAADNFTRLVKSKDRTVRIAGCVAIAEAAIGGMEFPTEVLEACAEIAGESGVAVTALAALCKKPTTAERVVRKLEDGWQPGAAVILKLLGRAVKHKVLVERVKQLAKGIVGCENDAQTAKVLASLVNGSAA
jgi:hypothetical protein